MSGSRRYSLFRPAGGVDQRVLERQALLVAPLDRRNVLRGAVSLGALTFLTGCDVSNDEQVRGALEAVSSLNNHVQAALFDPEKLAPTYAADQVLKPPRYNAYYPIDKVRPIDLATWQLTVTGLVKDDRPWRVADFAAMPQRDEIIRHVCVEGWDYIGQWSGVPLRDFLDKIGADPAARYVGFKCYDGYTSSLDMASARHPQTLLATHYAGEPLGAPFGAPVRVRTAVKLGFKNPKWITEILISDTWHNGYWEDRGYNWFGGI